MGSLTIIQSDNELLSHLFSSYLWFLLESQEFRQKSGPLTVLQILIAQSGQWKRAKWTVIIVAQNKNAKIAKAGLLNGQAVERIFASKGQKIQIWNAPQTPTGHLY